MHNSVSPLLHRKLVVKFCLALGIIVIIVNTLVINFVLHFPSQHYSITVAALNTTAGLATILVSLQYIDMVSGVRTVDRCYISQ
jgi:hypothetical protein